MKSLRENFNIPLIFLTLGKDGSRAYYKNITVEKPTFSEIKPIEKTGAGDTFEGCALHFVLEYGLEGMSEKRLCRLLSFANAGASLITARKGALKVMPGREEIEGVLR